MTKEYEKGNTAKFTATVTDSDGNIVSPTQVDGDYQIFIEIKDADTETIMQDTIMNTVGSSDTQFQKTWETTEGMTTGQYEVEISASVSGHNTVNRENIKLVDVI